MVTVKRQSAARQPDPEPLITRTALVLAGILAPSTRWFRRSQLITHGMVLHSLIPTRVAGTPLIEAGQVLAMHSSAVATQLLLDWNRGNEQARDPEEPEPDPHVGERQAVGAIGKSDGAHGGVTLIRPHIEWWPRPQYSLQ